MKALASALLCFAMLAMRPCVSFGQARPHPVQGTFRGVVVTSPARAKADDGFIYVLGKNRMLRRVSVGKAKVSFGAEVPEHERGSAPVADLVEGAEVRVTAKPDGTGNWQALAVEILKLAPPVKPRQAADRI